MSKVSRRKSLLLLLAFVALGFGVYFFLRPGNASSPEKTAALKLANTGEAGEALDALKVALEKHPKDAELLRAIVRVMSRSGASAVEVEPYLKRWCDAAPNEPEAFRTRMNVLNHLKRQNDAIEPAEHLLQLQPDDNEVRTQLAGLYLAVGRFDDAARECRTLIEKARGSQPDLIVGLARVEAARGNNTEAAKLLDQVLVQMPENTSAILMRAIVYQQTGDDAKAIEWLGRVRARDPHERVLQLHHLGQSLARSGKTDEAKKTFDELLAVQNALAYAIDARLMPENVAMQTRAGRAMLAAGWPEEGIKLLEESLQRLGAERTMLLALAECYEKVGAKLPAEAARNQAAKLP